MQVIITLCFCLKSIEAYGLCHYLLFDTRHFDVTFIIIYILYVNPV
jgi:hypothetical protein